MFKHQSAGLVCPVIMDNVDYVQKEQLISKSLRTVFCTI